MQNTNVNMNMGFFGWLTLIFVAAKLLGYVTWSWWFVFSPILIPVGVVLAVIGLIAILKVLTDE